MTKFPPKLQANRAPVADERAAFARHVSGRDDLELYQIENVIDANLTRWTTWRAARDYYQQARAALASAPVAGEAQKPVAWMLVGRLKNSEPKFTLADPAGIYESVYAPLYAAPQASAEASDFVAHLARQAEFSARTFGPGARVAGVCDHIRKELIEVETSGGDLKEWVDVIILGLDGAWRSGATPQEIIAAIVAKQAKNEARTWPDWRTVDPTKAIEHDRGGQP